VPPNYCIGENYLAACSRAAGENSAEAKPFADGIRNIIQGTSRHFVLEYPCHSPDTFRWFIGQADPLPLGDGTGAVITHIDITDHRLINEALIKSERQIRNSERRYRTLFENSGTGIVIIDRDGIYQMVNKQGAAAMGTRPEDIVGKSIRDFFTIDIANHYIKQNRDIIDSGIGRDFEASFPIGTLIRTFLMTDRCIADEHGRGIALQSSSFEITDRKHLEDELVASETRFRAVFEHSFIGLSITTMDGRETRNHIACAMLGYTQHEMSTRTWRDYTYPEDIPNIEQAIDHLLHSDAPAFRIAQRLLHRNGNIMWAETSCVLIRDKGGDPLYFLTAMLDITELRTTQENLHALAGHLQSAREEERHYIAREIHDHFSQVLSALKIDLTLMMKDIRRHDESGLCIRIAQQLESFDASLETIIIELRHLVTGLRPEILETLGILAAMEFEIREFGRNSGLPTQFTTNVGDIPIDMQSSIALYRILQESLANIREHALAQNVAVSFERTPDALVLQIEDDGRGFPTAPPAHQIPYGILGMRERALLLKGEFSLQRTPAGKTRVIVRVPWPPVINRGNS
jgi:PAS domain S-box-containing protein